MAETVEQVKFDYAVSILASNHAEIRIECLFVSAISHGCDSSRLTLSMSAL